jgi:uncharacterized protein YfbU (UPF0304 family)
MRTVVERGYELDYDSISHFIYDEDSIMSSEECLEVIDILDMFRCLKYAYDELRDKSGIDEVWVNFGGFDGNRETKQLGYARFLLEDEENFPNLGRDVRNSHMPILDIYRQMLAEWKRSSNKCNLTKGDIIRITSAPKLNQ